MKVPYFNILRTCSYSIDWTIRIDINFLKHLVLKYFILWLLIMRKSTITIHSCDSSKSNVLIICQSKTDPCTASSKNEASFGIFLPWLLLSPGIRFIPCILATHLIWGAALNSLRLQEHFLFSSSLCFLFNEFLVNEDVLVRHLESHLIRLNLFYKFLLHVFHEERRCWVNLSVSTPCLRLSNLNRITF